MQRFLIEERLAENDVGVVWDFLSTEAYWGRWRTRDDFETQLANAWRVVVARETPGGPLVGFARVTSDGVAVAYIADVFVVPRARRNGVGRTMIEHLLDLPRGARFRWMLHTADAHLFYRAFGFDRPENDQYLERPHRSG